MIRIFNQSDLKSVLDIWLRASVEAHDFMEKGFWESKVADMRDIYLPRSEIFVYEKAGEVKGFMALSGDVLAALFVDPDEQRRGIGSRLMNKAKTERRILKLTVYMENTKGFDFYEKHGFRKIGEQVDIHTGHVEVLMLYDSQVEMP